MQPVEVHKGRTTIITISMGFNVSDDEFSSQIRVDKDPESELIAEWVITFNTDGSDGELVATIDDLVSATITQSTGYMDLKRVSGGEPLPVWDDPLEVLFLNVITV